MATNVPWWESMAVTALGTLIAVVFDGARD